MPIAHHPILSRLPIYIIWILIRPYELRQPMLQELGKQNPALLRLINENQGEFLRLINEAVPEDAEG